MKLLDRFKKAVTQTSVIKEAKWLDDKMLTKEIWFER